jgi:hypothetical protein
MKARWLAFTALLVASAFAADSEVVPNAGAIVDGNPVGAAKPLQTSPRRAPRPPRARVSTTKKKKDDRGSARTGSQMPPAGSAATGGTPTSPGGAPTTPYGSPY